MYSLKNNGELESIIDDHYYNDYPDYDIETTQVGTKPSWFRIKYKCKLSL